MNVYKIKDILIRRKESIKIEDSQNYKQVTIRMHHKGVTLRTNIKGFEVATKVQNVVKAGDFIMSKIDARNSAFGIVPSELDNAIVSNDFPAYIINTKVIDPQYFLLYTQTNDFSDKCIRSSKGTTNRQRLKEEIFLNFDIKLPDIEKQKELVLKLKRRTHPLENISTQTNFQKELLIKLKSAILQEAITGKLVPQDENDEDAGILLEKIKAEREKLIKEGKIKKDKPLPEIKPEEIPFEIPKSWRWVRLGDVVDINLGLTHTPKYVENGIPFLSVKDLSSGFIDFSRAKYITRKEYDSLPKGSKPMKGDILFGRVGTIGCPSILEEEIEFGLFVSAGYLRIFGELLNRYYIKWFINSDLFHQHVDDNVKGAAQKNLNTGWLREFLVPIPPLPEQQRIVAKTESLFGLIDQLEQKLNQSKELTLKLTEAVLNETLES